MSELSNSICPSTKSDNSENVSASTTIIRRKIKLSTSNQNQSNSNQEFKDKDTNLTDNINIKEIISNGKKFIKLPEPNELVVSKLPEKGRYLIGCAIMVKDEERIIAETLKSFLPFCDCLIVYDTGSTDNTLNIIKLQAEKLKKPLFLITGQFINFSASRNVLLKYSNKIADYLLLPDSNDILQGGEQIRPAILENHKREESKKWNALFVSQLWATSSYPSDYLATLDKQTAESFAKSKRVRPFKNIRIIRTNLGWTYNCVIHENVYLQPGDLYEGLSIPDNPNNPVIGYNTNIVFYQDRDEDNLKTDKRLASDILLLEKELEKNPEDLRTIFYLGQTNECMRNIDEALKWYIKRADMGPVSEEKYLSVYRAGKLSLGLKKPMSDAIKYLLVANNLSLEICGEGRAEPLVLIAQAYIDSNMLYQAYYYLKEACRLSVPENINLMVEQEFYDEIRWKLVLQVAVKMGEFNDAIYAAKKAAQNLGIEVSGNKLITTHKNKDEAKLVELQKFIDFCVEQQNNAFPAVKKIKTKYEAEFNKHKTCMVFPSATTVQLSEFKSAVQTGNVKNVGTIPGPLQRGFENVSIASNSNMSNINNNKKKKNKKKK
jgi:glycosyltransferase involved in cell wall biosynthesis